MVEEKKLKKNLADNLIRLRNERGLTQEALVSDLKKQDVDISRTALASYENRRSFPKLDVLLELSRYFNKSIDDLLIDIEERGNVFEHNVVSKLDLNDLLKDFSEILTYFKLYRSLYFNLVEIVLDAAESKEARENLLHTIMGVYAHEKLKLPVLHEVYSEKLDHLEISIFKGVHHKIPLNELAEQLNMSPEEVTAVFIHAKDKIIDLLLN
ncbi:MAG TPA: helix-turn-helix transcriptional regulator [Haliscomenobacter sp.]|uniref:helix-turn-helix transcriptional regulator n=1 Tax=Haliscomenobacter sp. TaxID=2717303 RepID=UPI002CC0EB52|nr:helix-turn-helix transcriptional regulator [Haliscomenobacter sp.]HOY21492.1 helix-turn-helix transcriptional regulator [Haliscomenobacter sp.]